jgi:hypothetical protein
MDLEIENFFPRFKCKREIDPYCSINSGLNTHFIKADKDDLFHFLLFLFAKKSKSVKLVDGLYELDCHLID